MKIPLRNSYLKTIGSWKTPPSFKAGPNRFWIARRIQHRLNQRLPEPTYPWTKKAREAAALLS